MTLEHITRLEQASETVAQRHRQTWVAQQVLHRAIKDARAGGMTLQAIGDVLGLSEQRIKQLSDR